jgi:hypothetical protein
MDEYSTLDIKPLITLDHSTRCALLDGLPKDAREALR